MSSLQKVSGNKTQRRVNPFTSLGDSIVATERLSNSFHCQGLWIPIEVWRLFEDNKITAKEVLLASVISTLVDCRDPAEGCFATNQFLAQSVKVMPRQVQNMVKNLIHHKSIEMIGWKPITTGRLRVLVPCSMSKAEKSRIKEGLEQVTSQSNARKESPSPTGKGQEGGSRNGLRGGGCNELRGGGCNGLHIDVDNRRTKIKDSSAPQCASDLHSPSARSSPRTLSTSSGFIPDKPPILNKPKQRHFEWANKLHDAYVRKSKLKSRNNKLTTKQLTKNASSLKGIEDKIGDIDRINNAIQYYHDHDWSWSGSTYIIGNDPKCFLRSLNVIEGQMKKADYQQQKDYHEQEVL